MNNTWDGTILKYKGVNLTEDSNSFMWKANTSGKWSGNTVDVYLGSMDTEPVASFKLTGSSWTEFKDHLIKFDKVVPKGTYDVFIKFGGEGKSSNYYYFAFATADENTLAEHAENPDGTTKE